MPKRRANGEGSIYARKKDGKTIGWCAQITGTDGKPVYKYAKTQKEAREKLDELKKEFDAGVTHHGKDIYFTDWMKEWLEVYAKPHIKPGTYQFYYLLVYKIIIPEFPRVKLKEVRKDILQKFLNKLATERSDGKPGGYSENYISHIKARMHSALDVAEDVGLIAKSPARRLKVAGETAPEKRTFNKDEQSKFEAVVNKTCKGKRNDIMFLLILYTGLRPGEACGLKESDIDFDKGEFYVRRTIQRVTDPDTGETVIQEGPPKTPQSKRTIPLSKKVEGILKQAIEARNGIENKYDTHWTQQDYIFIGKMGIIKDPKIMGRSAKRLCSMAAVPHVTPHGMRHTFASRWVEKGLDIKTLSDIMGHSDTKMTLNTYVHSGADQKRDGMAIMADDDTEK